MPQHYPSPPGLATLSETPCPHRFTSYSGPMNYAFLGAGKMALALIHGMLRANLCTPGQITVSSRTQISLENVSAATSVNVVRTNAEAVRAADVVILCVKPVDALDALAQAREEFSGKFLISVVTGLMISALEAAAPGARVMRAMPNTAAMIGKSATALAPSPTLSHQDINLASDIFEAVGEVFPANEKQLDAITGLSGSGPAFIYLILEALSDGGVAAGLPRKMALDLAIETVAGAAEMAASTKEHPAILREMVTSPGGTTIAGLTALEKGGVRASFISAVLAATARSQELSAR